MESLGSGVSTSERLQTRGEMRRYGEPREGNASDCEETWTGNAASAKAWLESVLLQITSIHRPHSVSLFDTVAPYNDRDCPGFVKPTPENTNLHRADGNSRNAI